MAITITMNDIVSNAPDPDGHKLTVKLWNIEWAPLTGKRVQHIRSLLGKFDPDIICLSESYEDFLSDGHIIGSDPDYGYNLKPRRRKVLLWSKRPWTKSTRGIESELPPGRFVRGVTESPIGPVDISGLCIPWFHAHVRSGKKNRKAWQDHAQYLDALPRMIAGGEYPQLILGDFNQTHHRRRAPEALHRQLFGNILENLKLLTGGGKPDERLVDHVAVSPQLKGNIIGRLPKQSADRIHISDH